MATRYHYAASLSWGGDIPTAELEVEVSYEVTWGRPAQTYGPPERCYPADPDEIDDIRVETIDGVATDEWLRTACEYMPGETVRAITDKLEMDHYDAMLEAAGEQDYDAASDADFIARTTEDRERYGEAG